MKKYEIMGSKWKETTEILGEEIQMYYNEWSTIDENDKTREPIVVL